MEIVRWVWWLELGAALWMLAFFATFVWIEAWMMNDTETQAFNVLMAQADAYKRGALAIWTVYDRPSDHPEGFIARMHEVEKDGPRATDKTLEGELEEIRRVFVEAGLTTLPREAGDEPQIVESWI